jgi:glycosyltransferase involved in cell wall biosynthesis
MILTVLFSTHNGAGTLPAMLAKLRELAIPPGTELQILAVDNNSSDATGDILRAASADLPLTAIRHGERGKNRALNAALPLTKGELIVFTDDDVLPDVNWLVELQRAAAENPDFDIFGGHIVPHWPSPPPRWIIERTPLGVTFALTDPKLPAGEIFPGLIWGPNMMVRRSVFDTGLRFNEAIGPNSGQYIMGSETEFNIRAQGQGHACYFKPRAVVQHIIRPKQMEPQWVVQRAYRFGRNAWNQYANGSEKDSVPTVMGMPRWRFKSYVEHWLQARKLHRSGLADEAFNHEWELAFLRGYFAQWWQSRRGGSLPAAAAK